MNYFVIKGELCMYNEQIIFNNLNRPTFVMPKTSVAKGIICPAHFHAELEFLYVNKGLVKYCADDIDYIAKPGDVMFINSKVPHYTEALEDRSSHSFIQFNEPKSSSGQMRFLAKFLKQDDTPAYLFKSDDPDREEIAGYINQIVTGFNHEGIFMDYKITGIIYMIISLLYRKNILNSNKFNINGEMLQKLAPVFDYIHENYDKELNLLQLSKILNINEQYFCRMFKKTTGSNVTDYINFIRIYNAEKLMKTKMNISEIAERTGFSSLSYFNKIFKKHKQISPREYKKLCYQKDGLTQQ